MKSLTYFFIFLITSGSYAQERLVKVNDNNFAVYTKGLETRKANTPVLIFENGMGEDIGSWSTIIDQLAVVVPVLAYDRAGVGKSDKIYQMPTLRQTAENLKALLKTMNIPPPYVIAGHSMGGLYARDIILQI